jgi:predicted secreted hydrolase
LTTKALVTNDTAGVGMQNNIINLLLATKAAPTGAAIRMAPKWAAHQQANQPVDAGADAAASVHQGHAAAQDQDCGVKLQQHVKKPKVGHASRDGPPPWDIFQ